MGAGQSKSDAYEHVFPNETPIQFSDEVVNHLSDHLASPETTPQRQSTLDAHIRSRIQTEISRLREEEQHVKGEIERALEKENLDRERGMVEDETEDEESGVGHAKSATVLLGDLEELRRQVERFHAKKDDVEFVTAQTRSNAVVQCYKTHSQSPLDCWREVQEFKASVANIEEHYIESLR